MRARIAIWTLILAVTLVLPLVAGDGHKCGADAQACLNKMAEKLKDRGWVGVEFEKNEDGSLTIMAVVEDSPAEASGLRAGDVVLAVNGVEFGEEGEENKEKLYAVKKQMKAGSTIEYTVQRKDKKKNVDITLAKLPDEVLYAWVGEHLMKDHAVIEVASN